MQNALFISCFILCSASGAGLRLAITHLAKIFFGHAFYGTLCVNFLGSAIIGITYLLLNELWQPDKTWHYLIVTGFLGSLTTFSGFSLEVVDMLMQKQWLVAVVYSFLSLFLCVAVTFMAIRLGQGFIDKL